MFGSSNPEAFERLAASALDREKAGCIKRLGMPAVFSTVPSDVSAATADHRAYIEAAHSLR